MDGDISQMLRQVMENPQFGSMMQAAKSQMGDMDPAKMMEKLPEMMTVLGPMMKGILQEGDSAAAEGQKKEAEGESETVRKEGKMQEEMAGKEETAEGKADAPADGFKLPGGNFFFKPGSREKRNKLLSALKPYLSPARCAIVDRAMSAMQLGEILGTMTPNGK